MPDVVPVALDAPTRPGQPALGGTEADVFCMYSFTEHLNYLLFVSGLICSLPFFGKDFFFLKLGFFFCFALGVKMVMK